ncbi:MAG: hypothetical protein Nkreftii_002409 [Candidatus Nitrospira kreftii]|uniref:Uncharacterized protein n=1 Tax=Candidatus Nitrospira kreftii TaxID=2652173 RepID=A0A7S8J043_9BACT|nr:MAG: hypothetical protein Nkreftii_002409 [Candidatus Nitrospira kreftii]
MTGRALSQRRRLCMKSIVSVLLTSTSVSIGMVAMLGAAELDEKLHEQRDGLLRNAEDMVAHGGMGDAKAIVQHCGEAARYAESLIKEVSISHPDREDTVVPLNEVIRQCKRVSEIGDHADPGLLLNPAIKARSAARSAIRSLRAAK